MSSKGRVLLLATAGQVLAYLPWYNYSAVLPILKEEFGFSYAAAGQVLAVFQLGYLFSVLAAGWLVDRVGPRAVLVVACVVTGVGSVGFSLFAHDLATSLAWRLLAGMGAGGIYTPGLALLCNWYSPSARGRALGIYTSGTVVAIGVAYLVAAPLAVSTSWRVAVFATSLTCFVAAALYMWMVPERDGREERTIAAPAAADVRTVPVGPAALITVGYMGHLWEQYGFWGWVGPFFVASAVASGVAGDAAVALGGTLGAIAISAGVAGSWLGGVLADRLGRTTAASMIAITGACCCALLGWLLGGPLPLVVVAGLACGFLVVADSAIYKVGLTELIPEGVRGTGLGLQAGSGYVVSAIAPLAFGSILDVTGAIDGSAASWGWAFASLGAGALVSPLAMLALRTRPVAVRMGEGRR